MCKKTNYKIPNPRIDKCMKNKMDKEFKKALKLLDSKDFDTLMDYVKYKQKETVKKIFEELLEPYNLKDDLTSIDCFINKEDLLKLKEKWLK